MVSKELERSESPLPTPPQESALEGSTGYPRQSLSQEARAVPLVTVSPSASSFFNYFLLFILFS